MPDNTFSLFDASAHKKAKKPDSFKKNVPAKGPASAPKKSAPQPTYVRPPVRLDPEVQGMLDKMHDMHRDIEKKLQRIYELSGLSRDQIKNFVDDPKNFSRDQWNNLQANRERIEGKLLAFLGAKVKADRDRMKNQELNRQKAQELTKNRKSKTVAARKKNWISMR